MSENLFDEGAAAEKAAKPAKAPKAEKPAKAAGKPVKAVAKIVYGAGVTAEPGALFVPTSDKELAELEAAGAVVELSEAELALWEKLNG